MSKVGTPPPHNLDKPHGLVASIKNNKNSVNNWYSWSYSRPPENPRYWAQEGQRDPRGALEGLVCMYLISPYTLTFFEWRICCWLACSVSWCCSATFQPGRLYTSQLFQGGGEYCRYLLSIDSQLNRIDPSTNIFLPNPERGYRTKFEILLEEVFPNII